MSAWSALPSAETPTVLPSRSLIDLILSAVFGAVTRANSGSRPVTAKRRMSAPTWHRPGWRRRARSRRSRRRRRPAPASRRCRRGYRRARTSRPCCLEDAAGARDLVGHAAQELAAVGELDLPALRDRRRRLSRRERAGDQPRALEQRAPGHVGVGDPGGGFIAAAHDEPPTLRRLFHTQGCTTRQVARQMSPGVERSRHCST